MSTIMGPEADGELLSPSNGIIVTQCIVRAIKQGFLLIGPNLPNEATDRDFARWHDSDPKDHKMKISDHNCDQVDMFIESHSRSFLDLHGTKFDFPWRCSTEEPIPLLLLHAVSAAAGVALH
ncbi:MAG: hypothetical protein Q9184_006588 [Pyrenodesmia sp. 2 TL-2023]